MAEYSFVPSHREDFELVFFEEHLYRKKKTEANKVRYICYKSNCPAKLEVVGATCQIPLYSGTHNHGSQMAQKMEFQFKKRVREACKNSNRSTREIYNEERAKYNLILSMFLKSKLKRYLCTEIPLVQQMLGSRRFRGICLGKKTRISRQHL